VEEAPDGRRPLRIAVLGDLNGLHTRRWLAFFTGRGHEVHAISFYPPASPPDGVKVHALRDRAAPGPASENAGRPASTLRQRLPPTAERLIQYVRYARAGLRRVVREISPDVFQAHFAAEHGFYGTAAGFHPYVVSCWGSDIFRVPATPAGRLIVRRALRAADVVTVNDPEMASRSAALGARRERLVIARLGIDPAFLEPLTSVNEGDSSEHLIVLSDRALEPLYNIEAVIRGFALVADSLPSARLVVANDGSDRGRLEALVRELRFEGRVEFTGYLDAARLRGVLAQAAVYVSVPDSDSLSVSTMEAMAAGAFPIVSDLPSQDGWIEDGRTGLRVPAGDWFALSVALRRALSDPELRRQAVAPNRAKVEAEGNREWNLGVVEERMYALVAGRKTPSPD